MCGGGGELGLGTKETTQIPRFMAFLAKKKQETILSPSSGIYVSRIVRVVGVGS